DHQRAGGAGAAECAGDAPRTDERGGGDRAGRGARRAVAHRGAGHERRRRAHGAALPAGRTVVTPRAKPLIMRGGRVIDPANAVARVTDLRLADGRVAGVGDGAGWEGETFDARGLVVAPGFVDLHTHLREPGQEYKETVASGALAAAHG